MASAARKEKPSIGHSLKIEIEKAKTLVATIHEAMGDDETKKLTIESETDLFEWIDAAVARIAQVETLALAIKVQSDQLTERKHRLTKQADNLRAALLIAMETAGICKHEGPLATVSLRPVGRALEIVDEPNIPSRFWKPQPPVLDKSKLISAIKSGEVVTGARLDNGSLTVQISKG